MRQVSTRWLMGVALCVACGQDSHDGSESADALCTDTRVKEAPADLAQLGVTTDGVRQLLDGSHSAALSWSDGSVTVALAVVNTSAVYYATSERSPSLQADIAPNCRDHLTAVADVMLSTADGRLAERLGSLKFFSYDGVNFTATSKGLAADHLRGSYPLATGSTCLLDLNFALTLSASDFAGEVDETIAAASCADVANTTAVGERTSGRWSGPP